MCSAGVLSKMPRRLSARIAGLKSVRQPTSKKQVLPFRLHDRFGTKVSPWVEGDSMVCALALAVDAATQSVLTVVGTRDWLATHAPLIHSKVGGKRPGLPIPNGAVQEVELIPEEALPHGRGTVTKLLFAKGNRLHQATRSLKRTSLPTEGS